MSKIIRLLLLIAVLALVPGPSVSAAGNGTLQGVVTNGTANGGSTAGLTVTLHVFQGNAEKERLNATTDASGGFRFEGLEVGSDWLYLLRASYQGVIYSEGPLQFEANTTQREAKLLVYEATTESQNIVVERAHLLLSAEEQTLKVTEMHIFTNPGDRTYIGREEVQGRRVAARFLLPPGATNLTLEDGSLDGRFLAIRGGFVDTEPQWPGQTRVLFSYEIHCQGGTCELVKEITHPTVNLNVLLSASGMQLETDRLTPAGTMGSGAETFANYAGRNLAVGERLRLRIIRSAATGAPASTRPRRQPLALGIVVLAAAGALFALGYPLLRKTPPSTEADGGVAPANKAQKSSKPGP